MPCPACEVERIRQVQGQRRDESRAVPLKQSRTGYMRENVEKDAGLGEQKEVSADIRSSFPSIEPEEGEGQNREQDQRGQELGIVRNGQPRCQTRQGLADRVEMARNREGFFEVMQGKQRGNPVQRAEFYFHERTLPRILPSIKARLGGFCGVLRWRIG